MKLMELYEKSPSDIKPSKGGALKRKKKREIIDPETLVQQADEEAATNVSMSQVPKVDPYNTAIRPISSPRGGRVSAYT
jgi:hypothetical protein